MLALGFFECAAKNGGPGWGKCRMHTVEIVLLVLLLGALTGIAARYVRAIPLR